MKSIKFTDQELDSIIQMYQDELEDAQTYITQIQNILNKINPKPSMAPMIDKEPKVPKKRGRKPSLKVVEKAPPKKRGRKPKVVLPVQTDTAPEIVAIPVIKDQKPKREKKVKVLAEKKTKQPEPIVAASVESVVGSLLLKKPEKAKKAGQKKQPRKQKTKGKITLVNLSKPLGRKKAETKPDVTGSTLESDTAPSEQ